MIRPPNSLTRSIQHRGEEEEEEVGEEEEDEVGEEEVGGRGQFGKGINK